MHCSVASGDFGGTIESSGEMLALLKTGSGQLILSGTDTYKRRHDGQRRHALRDGRRRHRQRHEPDHRAGRHLHFRSRRSRCAEAELPVARRFFIFRPRCLPVRPLAADFEWGARAEHAALIACRRRRRTALARPAAEALGPIVSERECGHLVLPVG